jgi:hypothetical protein
MRGNCQKRGLHQHEGRRKKMGINRVVTTNMYWQFFSSKQKNFWIRAILSCQKEKKKKNKTYLSFSDYTEYSLIIGSL